MAITDAIVHALRGLAEQGVDLSDYEIVMSKRTMHEFAEENDAFLHFKANERSHFWGLPIRLDSRLEYKQIYVMKGGNE